MPRRSPRVGRSTASPNSWNQNPPAPAPPVNDFDLQYRDNPAGYVVAGGNTPLVDLLDPSGNVIVRGWEGLAQPATVTCRKQIPNPQVPADFECSYTHKHRRWASIDGQGQPSGGRLATVTNHTHTFGLEEFISADDEDGNIQWYPIHRH